jgi:hypothetical protein
VRFRAPLHPMCVCDDDDGGRDSLEGWFSTVFTADFTVWLAFVVPVNMLGKISINLSFYSLLLCLGSLWN